MDPVCDVVGPAGSEDARRCGVQAMLLSLVDDQLLGRTHLIQELVRMLDRAELVSLACHDEVRTGELCADAPQRECRHEPVELVLVFMTGHVHEPQLERGRCGLHDRMTAWLVADESYRAADHVAATGGYLGCPIRAEADAIHCNPVLVDLRSHLEPGEHCSSGIEPVVVGYVDGAGGALALSGTVDGKHGRSSRQELVSVQRDHRLLEAIHAVDDEHAREAIAMGARGQMKPARQGRLAERDLDPLDVVVRIFRVLRVALDLLLIETKVGRRVLEDRPLGTAVEHGGNVETLPSGDGVSSRLGRTGSPLPTLGRANELPRNVVKALHARPNALEVAERVWPTGCLEVKAAALVPVHTDRPDHRIEQPPLLLPTPRGAHCPQAPPIVLAVAEDRPSRERGGTAARPRPTARAARARQARRSSPPAPCW